MSNLLIIPKHKKNKIVENKSISENLNQADTSDNSTTFDNLEYKGLYNFDKPFKVKSNKAYILNEEPDIVYMDKMHVILYLDDARIINITSDKGRYNKVTYDCFFEINVKATDEDTVILAENLDLLATEDSIKVYNNVFLDHPTGDLRADRMDYNFETKYFKVSMFDDKAIKMKVIQ